MDAATTRSPLALAVNGGTGDFLVSVEEWVKTDGQMVGLYQFQHSLFSDGEFQIHLYGVDQQPLFLAQIHKGLRDHAIEMVRAIAQFGGATLWRG